MKPRNLASSLGKRVSGLLAVWPAMLGRLMLIGLMLWLSLAAAEPDYQQSAARLQQIKAQIDQLQKDLRQERARQDKASAELRKLDEAVSRAAGRLRDVEIKRAETSKSVTVLQADISAQRAHMAQHQDQLGQQLRTSYANGSSSYLKLLLNTDDPLRMGRLLTYHRYLHLARREALQSAVAELQKLNAMEETLANQLSELEVLRRQESARQQDILAARRQRAEALAAIDAHIAAQDQQLQGLQKDAADLEQLMQRLQDVLADVKDLRFDEQPFSSRRGQLGWPLRGPVLARFGQDRGLGDMHWNGILIEGQAGAVVTAIARGHVVFADWLRGFGLLIIIDHGDGFMTLYGHNEAIFKENGDWVQPGETIATVGSGGRPRRTGLYFEVRSGGKPVDPLRWLQPAVQAKR